MSERRKRRIGTLRPMEGRDLGNSTAGHVHSVRPYYVLPPRQLDDVLGRTLAEDVRANTSTSDEDLT